MYDEMTEWSLLTTFHPKNIIVWVSLKVTLGQIIRSIITPKSEDRNRRRCIMNRNTLRFKPSTWEFGTRKTVWMHLAMKPKQKIREKTFLDRVF